MPGQMACQPLIACIFFDCIWTHNTEMKYDALVCPLQNLVLPEKEMGGTPNDDETFDDMDDEQQQEIQERMRRLNARSTHKAMATEAASHQRRRLGKTELL